MKFTELLIWLAFVFTVIFVTWGLTTISQGMTKIQAGIPFRIEVSVSAYNPTIAQCDTTPFIMASGKRVYKGAIALSRDLERDFGLKFGHTIVLLGRTFTFEDRMNRRHKRRVDIFMWSKKKALQFGRQKAIMVIKG